MFLYQKECQTRVLVNFPEIQLRLKPSLASQKHNKNVWAIIVNTRTPSMFIFYYIFVFIKDE